MQALLTVCGANSCQRNVVFAQQKQLGALAQLGEHLLCKQGVIGSIPIRSTISFLRESIGLRTTCLSA